MREEKNSTLKNELMTEAGNANESEESVTFLNRKRNNKLAEKTKEQVEKEV